MINDTELHTTYGAAVPSFAAAAGEADMVLPRWRDAENDLFNEGELVADSLAGTMMPGVPDSHWESQEKVDALEMEYRRACHERGIGPNYDRLLQIFLLNVAEWGLGCPDPFEVLKIGAKRPRYVLNFCAGGDWVKVDLGACRDVFNFREVSLRLLDSPLVYSLPAWSRKAWTTFAGAIIRAARPVHPSPEELQPYRSGKK